MKKEEKKDRWFKNWCPCTSCQISLQINNNIMKGKKGNLLSELDNYTAKGLIVGNINEKN